MTSDNEYFFVNHGAFGAVAKVGFDAAAAWRAYAELQPLKFIDRELLPLIVHTIREFAPTVGSRRQDLVFIPSATVGLNTVIDAASKSWEAGDEVITLDIGYGAVKKMVDARCADTGAIHIEVVIALPSPTPEAVITAVKAALSPRTKFACFDHVTSNTALILPIYELVKLCQARGVKVLIDGAHGAGMLKLELEELGAEWYVSNLHKWYCAPRGTAFLWARRDAQAELRPLVVSHVSTDGFTSSFVWDGNRDYSSVLAILSLIKLWDAWDPAKAREYMNRLVNDSAATLANAWGTEVFAPPNMIGAMVLVRIPSKCAGLTEADDAFPAHAKYVQDELFHTYKVEAPIKAVASSLYVRISAHVYNRTVDYKALSSAIISMRDTQLGVVTVCTKGGGCG